MRLPDYLGVLGALVVGGVLTIVLLAGSLGTAPALPTRPPVSIPPLPTPTADESLPSAVPSGTPAGSAEQSSTVAIGQAAPALKVTLTDGSLMDTADFSGPLWVNFMASWCPQCATELPMMERFQGQLKDQMTILVIDVGEDRATVRDFLKGLHVDLTVGLDPNGVIQRQWGANALPIHIWVDADGVVQQIVYGGAPEQSFIEAITALVPEFSADQ